MWCCKYILISFFVYTNSQGSQQYPCPYKSPPVHPHDVVLLWRLLLLHRPFIHPPPATTTTTMGCVGSKAAGGDGSADKHPNVFRVVNVNHEGDDLWCGQLEVTSSNLTLYRKRKPPTKWPLQCLRRYGYDNDTFIFEAGRRCDSGEGIYSFRCRRADVLFHLLQDFIQESTYNNNNNNNSLTVSSMDEVVQQTQERMDADVAELRRAMGAGTTTTTNNAQQTTTGGSNYIILHGNNAAMAHGNSRSPCHSPASASNTHNNNNNISSSSNNNYLEPLENGTNATATPTVTMTSETTTTTNPNSNIYTNSMMIPQAQLSPAAAAASSTKKSGQYIINLLFLFPIWPINKMQTNS